MGKPFAFRKKGPAKPFPPSDGAEDEAEMAQVEAEAHEMDDKMATCPKCGCEFDAETGEY